jgi:hypothetical protein
MGTIFVVHRVAVLLLVFALYSDVWERYVRYGIGNFAFAGYNLLPFVQVERTFYFFAFKISFPHINTLYCRYVTFL